MIFGTDGIRGIVDVSIDSKLAYKVGKAYAKYIEKHDLPKKVIVGKDTRISGDTYFSALASGLSDYGIDVIFVGIVSTPTISFLLTKMNIGGGVMITASHNDFTYNGLKLFDKIGRKLSIEDEKEVEEYYKKKIRPSACKGKITFNFQIPNIYKDYLLSECYCNLHNISIALDCANGSNFSIAPKIYHTLGANIIKVACNNDGKNINNDCGANHIDRLQKEVLCHSTDFGIAFDGDGDRLRVVLSDGKILDGDDILFILANYLKQKNKLNGLTIVGTIMTNKGLEESLKKLDISLVRCDVGDKNVINCLSQNHYSIGGEPSGHICIYEHNTTCDALFNSLYFLKVITENKIDIHQILSKLVKYPSLLCNLEVSKDLRKNWDDNLIIKQEIKNISDMYPNCRIVVRPSGTEPMIRLYVESHSDIENEIIISRLKDIIKKYNNI